jgi:[ribosomal protein S18]-alanine N-acetyltransferase
MMFSHDQPRFRIRDYRHSDFGALCAIDRQCFSESIAYSPEEMALGLSQPGAFALVAEEDGRVDAFALFCQERRHLGHLITIDILPEFRRMGLGRELMELGEQRLRDNGVSRLVLEVDVRNEQAIGFHERLGFAIRRRLPAYYADGGDALLMEKHLVLPPNRPPSPE